MKAPNYTQVPNDFLDEMLPRLGLAETKVLLIVFRLTFGWHRDSAKISRKLLTKKTGLAESNVIQAIKSLQLKNLIKKEVVGDSGEEETFYSMVIDEDLKYLDPTCHEDLKYLDPTCCRGGTPPAVGGGGTHRHYIDKEREKESNTPIAPLTSGAALGSGAPASPAASASKDSLKNSYQPKKQPTPLVIPPPETLAVAEQVIALMQEKNPTYKSVGPSALAREIQELLENPATATCLLAVVRYVLGDSFYCSWLFRKGNAGRHLKLNFAEWYSKMTAPKPQSLYAPTKIDRRQKLPDGTYDTSDDNLF